MQMKSGNDSNPDVGQETYFAPTERADPAELKALSSFAIDDPIAQIVLESVAGYLMILNSKRQVLAANEELLEALEIEHSDTLLGDRPGEVFDCVNAIIAPSGCGTDRKCSYCGAVLSIMASQETDSIQNGECSLTLRRNDRLECAEFKVRCTPLHIGDHRLTVVVLTDISASKRRDVLERVFLHDVFNTLSSLVGLAELIRIQGEKEISGKILFLSQLLTHEMQEHRMMMQAEQGELSLNESTRPISAVLADAKRLFDAHVATTNRHIQFEPVSNDINLNCDHRLLNRVLANMIKNALEATAEGGVVRVWSEFRNHRPGIVVQNVGIIPDPVQMQIFKRSFSTKCEPGHGIGTYSMKLFGEQYLGGTVSFTSNTEKGTCFELFLPPTVVT